MTTRATVAAPVEHNITTYYCPGPFFMGWHLYLDGEWARRGTYIMDRVVRLMGESPSFHSVSGEIAWWDAFVRRFVEQHPRGVAIRSGKVLDREAAHA